MKQLIVLLGLILTLMSTPAYAANDEKQITCLAENSYHEARGEPRLGKIAVMNVVMNRTRSKKFPTTPCGVIYQGCQFSWVCKGSRAIRSPGIYAEMKELARGVYTGAIGDHTKGALFFHSTAIRPNWGRSRIAVIGNHIFYR